MNHEVNLEYYVQDETLNYHIDNIVSYKKFLENLLGEIKSNNYNKNMIKLLSRHVEKSLSEISNDTTLFDNKQEDDNFIPSIRVVSIDSDSSDLSECNTDEDNEETTQNKLEFYKTKMELYSPFVSSNTPSKPNTLAYKKIYDDEPDFLDDSHNLLDTVYNKTPLTQSLCYETSISGYKTKLKDYLQPKNIHFSPDCVIPYKNFVGNQDLLEEKFDYLKDSTQLTSDKSVNMTTKIEDCRQPPEIFKPKDKLANEFLNNNLELNNYHYLKSFNLNRISNYCNSVHIY